MSPALGDLLNNSEKRENQIKEALDIGRVFKMTLSIEEGVTPKNPGETTRDKLFVVIGFDNDIIIGVLLINSKVNRNLPNSLKDLQYPISAVDYDFLRHNSFVDCSSIKPIKIEKFKEQFDWKNSFSPIKKDDLELIIGAVKESPSVTPKILKRFGLDDGSK
ncbi:hypothetical protein [Geofilum rubicundum]|uniref:Uncharacterized protein n=1 Tax=Geofilum rubicundum JCM 15548 TaxID=1236989 RepID=A0A0E9LST4_9BACT|nr:hypothetical protein [Geofilum rubicundum]GAO28319.1 hypothetical protein JCM15548_1398 [Geofilum rubicundum JCM 15548]